MDSNSDGAFRNNPYGPSNNPFFETDSVPSLDESQRRASNRQRAILNGPPPRTLLCFIDVKGTAQVAHYALVPVPPTYEEAMNVAFEAFQSQIANSKLLGQRQVEFALMIKCIVRLGDPSLTSVPTSTSIWADIHPRNKWATLVRDGDEILLCAKNFNPHPRTASLSPQDPRLKPVPDNYAGSKIVFCHRPYASSGYIFISLALKLILNYEDARDVAHALFQSQRKPFQSSTGWTAHHIKLYFNVTPRHKPGSAIGGTTQNMIDATTWIAIRNQGMLDPSTATEVEVIYEFQ